MIDYRKIAENIAEVKDIFNEELSVRDSFSLLRYLREKDTQPMTMRERRATLRMGTKLN